MSVPDAGEKEIRYTKYLRTLSDDHPAKQAMAIANVAPDKMGASFYTQALTTLRLFIDPNIYRITNASDFDLTSFGTEPKHALFFILPDERNTFYPIVTVIVVQQYERLVVAAKKIGNRLKYRVNYVLDEFGNFSKINEFEKKLTVARGYGIRWNIFLQSLSQLSLVYGKDITDIAKGNCRYWLYLQTNDMETNKSISEMIGKYTTSTYSLGSSMQKYSSPSSSANISLIERSLLMPEEIQKFARPYTLVISQDPPAVMQSPDISQWLFNRMLGMGNELHNTHLIMQDENMRMSFEGKISTKIWKPWENTQPLEVKSVPDLQKAAIPKESAKAKTTVRRPTYRRKKATAMFENGERRCENNETA
jgi:type IV secretion system protein VirD4